MTTFGFLIPSYVNSAASLQVFTECISNLQRFHPGNLKVIFTDETLPIKLKDLPFIQADPTILIIEKRYCGAEMNAYRHFYDTKWFDIGIVLHDSFILKKPLTNIEDIQDIKYIWNFYNHRVEWQTIQEPQTEYNIQHNIRTHDDQILHLCEKSLGSESEVFKWIKDIYYRKDQWEGCFGTMSIIRHDFLVKLQEKTHFLDIVPHIRDRRDRISMESIFALVCQYTLGRLVEAYDGCHNTGYVTNHMETATFRKCTLQRT